MHSFHQEIPGDAQTELFSPAWLFSRFIATLIDTSPTGIALLQSIRSKTGQIIDFRYQMANPIQYALTNYPKEDLLNLPLTKLNPDVLETGMLERLIQVVTTGRPNQQIEVYHLDGEVGHYNQVYVKAGDGVLMLVQDITYRPLSQDEHQQQSDFLAAIEQNDFQSDIRARLVALIRGKTY